MYILQLHITKRHAYKIIDFTSFPSYLNRENLRRWGMIEYRRDSFIAAIVHSFIHLIFQVATEKLFF